MKDIAILMPCWKSPELLKICIPSLLDSTKSDSEIIVILNEVDQESVQYLDSMKIQHIDINKNLGPAAVDLAIPSIVDRFKYVANINSDMLFSEGWDVELIKLYEENKPCTVSSCLVEPIHNGHSVYENLDFFNPNSHNIFNNFIKVGKYNTDVSVSYNHPILCSLSDFLKVNGYSDNMEQIWVDLKGRGLDDDFVYRLYKIYGDEMKYLKSNKSFVYHGISLNSKKLKHRQPGHEAFKAKNGMNINEFRKLIKYPH